MSSIAPINALPGSAYSPPTPSGAGVLPLVQPPLPADTPQQARDAQAAGQAAQAQPQGKPTAGELQQQIEKALADSRVQTNLRFRVDEEARRIVVSVVDADTGETILQIPDEAALAVARRLAATGSGLLDQEA